MRRASCPSLILKGSLLEQMEKTDKNQPKASRAPAALHFAGAKRPGHGTSHGLQNGGMFTFTRQVCITYDGWNMKERERGTAHVQMTRTAEIG